MATTEIVTDSDGSLVLLIPEEFQFSDVSRVRISREGQCLVITPIHKSWSSFADAEQTDEDFLQSREDVIAKNE